MVMFDGFDGGRLMGRKCKLLEKFVIPRLCILEQVVNSEGVSYTMQHSS